jgi:hypothetical protein
MHTTFDKQKPSERLTDTQLEAREKNYLPISERERQSMNAFGTASAGMIVISVIVIALRWLLGG